MGLIKTMTIGDDPDTSITVENAYHGRRRVVIEGGKIYFITGVAKTEELAQAGKFMVGGEGIETIIDDPTLVRMIGLLLWERAKKEPRFEGGEDVLTPEQQAVQAKALKAAAALEIIVEKQE